MPLNRFGYTLAEVEREHILDTLAACHGNRTRAANFLDISLRSLRMKLRCFSESGLPVPQAYLNSPEQGSGGLPDCTIRS
jgi:hypothetical protein